MDRDQLLHYAKISELAYLDSKESKIPFKELGYNKSKFFDIKGAQAYLLISKEKRVLVFRGTEPKQKSDVLADLEAGKNKAQVGGKVHVGFKKEVNKLWDEITVELEKSDSTLPLYVTGHSLGAGMATIACSRMLDKVECLITFGSPRVGDKVFVNDISKLTHYRVKNTNDIVTSVPPRFLKFRHHGTLVYIDYYGNIMPYHGWQLIKDQIRARFKAISKKQMFSGLYDHLMANYIKKLSN